MTLSPERLAALDVGWLRLLAHFDVEPAAALPIFDRLIAVHSELHRHYHTLEHVAEVLKVAGRLSRFADNPMAVQLAVWFHDAVYDPRAADNEDRSADLAGELLRPLGIPTDPVRELILATSHKAEPTTPDARVLVDADLAILGSSEVRYLRYTADIRREYSWVPDADYRAGRITVLRHFLARPFIYSTEPMRAEGEEPARRNLAAEVADLSN